MRTRPLLCLAAGLLASLPVLAQTGPDTAAELSLEELMRQSINQVTRDVEVSTASRFAQGATRAPSLTYVVTQADIETHGLRNLADILRTLPGLYVTNNTIFTYVGARSLGRPGDLNTRLLFLLDGRRLNETIDDAGAIGPEFPVDADQIERVEFTPGPGSALYGNNAFFGVVNVVTKRADKLAPLELRVGAATLGGRDWRISSARRSADNLEWGVSLSGFDQPRLELPDYVDAASAADYRRHDWDRGSKGSAYLAWDGLTLRIGHQQRLRGVAAIPEFDPPYSLVQGYHRTRATFASATYERALGEDWDLWLSLASQRSLYRVDSPFYDEGPDLLTYHSRFRGRWSTAEIRLGTQRWRGHYVTAGLDYQHDAEQLIDYGVLGEGVDMAFMGTDRRLGLYVQDEWRFAARQTLVLGLRQDRSDGAGRRLNPRLSWIWNAQENADLRLMYGSAFRGSNLNEFQLNQFYEQPTPRAERLRSLELAWDHAPSRQWRYQVSVYEARMRDLITASGEDGFFANSGPVRSRGIDLGLFAHWGQGQQLQMSWSLQRGRDDRGIGLSNSPKHLLKAQWSMPLGTLRLGLQLLAISRHDTEFVQQPGNALLNANALWRPDLLTDVQFGVYNLADRHYGERSDSGAGPAEKQEGRVFRLVLTRRFGS